MRFVSDFHRNGKLLRGINNIFISLIPKKDCPQTLNDFRPISLVGSLYKVLAKLLANRLKNVIGRCHFGYSICFCEREADFGWYFGCEQSG